MKRVIISLHGIRTRGEWQKDLAPVLAEHDFIPYGLDFGNSGVVRLALPRYRDVRVRWLRQEYERVTAETGSSRPSIIAHSFGTYLTARLLEQYRNLRFDKVIFCGSIVRPAFDWIQLLNAGQVNLVHNEYGLRDVWPRLAGALVRDAGPSGVAGFSQEHPRLVQQRFPYHKHSDFFHRSHFTDRWLPVLRRNFFAAEDLKKFEEIFDLATRTVARRLNVVLDTVRANIFLPDESGRLSIPEGLHYRMGYPTEELSVSIPRGEGCTGLAFKERRPTIAVIAQTWGKHDLPRTELNKVNPNLKWIVSSPIPDPHDADSTVGVLNVDGLNTEKPVQELEALIDDLGGLARAASETLADVC